MHVAALTAFSPFSVLHPVCLWLSPCMYSFLKMYLKFYVKNYRYAHSLKLVCFSIFVCNIHLHQRYFEIVDLCV